MKDYIFSNISKIIERDSKTTTYKFALLRGVIDIIQDNSPFITFSNERAYFSFGLLIEKWLVYYYPILESNTTIPQINGENNLAFENQFKRLIFFYKDLGGLSAFYNDLKNKGIPKYIEKDFIALSNKLKNTISMMPMKYIGTSINREYYSIFRLESPTSKKYTSSIDIQFLIENYGNFSIPIDYYEAFKVLGSFICGQDSILFKWASFSVGASKQNISIEKVINEVLKSPITERDVALSKKLYKNILQKEGKVFCVWTGKAITNYDIDHVIPFSIWKNNDLWNLLPSMSSMNNQKRDKIPSAGLIESRKDMIIHYWGLINECQPHRFKKEIQITLLGTNSFSDWEDTSIKKLQNISDYFISSRGFEEWNS
ncbi:hypothetical protein GCM10011514_35730 [Emticicia aquatilis]|uniref:HNH nuclease domain-containing protein n=1 Tax=Emticicia aquatilis TaxID=1537369 RepID=A0A916YZB0_9BACT|nr:HNH endonuclease domain-containing protein [Emticicia aquatilis]GGD68479.1 hypothetical protein GCM10011514_35730 [Emticicia aquatilis]